MATFPRGEVFYTLNHDALICPPLFERRPVRLCELVSARHIESEEEWRKRLAEFLANCDHTRGIDRQDLIIDLSSPWPIVVRSRLNCTFDGSQWTMHMDRRLLRTTSEEILRKDIVQISVDVTFASASYAWNTAVWQNDHTHHVVRKDCWRCQLFGRDPKILMAMMVAIQTNHESPRGLLLST
ncbi:hypothetical protein HY631_02030 [Candidatus Uhrbacteria bacterium]|nr:hypothetical protein [Candidatus Uhrbacteria bacterium]